jgi:uncharacterized protein (TIGR02246 family)
MNRRAQISDTGVVTHLKSQASTHHNAMDEIVAWLNEFAATVRARDYKKGRELFHDDAFGFGSVGNMLDGLDRLVEHQWKRVWNQTEGFELHLQYLKCGASGDVAWAAVPFSSQGIAPDGSRFLRRGRATYVLEKHDGRWRAVHSHHSLEPSDENHSKDR